MKIKLIKRRVGRPRKRKVAPWITTDFLYILTKKTIPSLVIGMCVVMSVIGIMAFFITKSQAKVQQKVTKLPKTSFVSNEFSSFTATPTPQPKEPESMTNHPLDETPTVQPTLSPSPTVTTTPPQKQIAVADTNEDGERRERKKKIRGDRDND